MKLKLTIFFPNIPDKMGVEALTQPKKKTEKFF